MCSYQPLPSCTRSLPDKRLRTRLNQLVGQLASQPEAPIPQATGGRNAMDAAYQFFDNRRVSPEAIVATSVGYTLGNLHESQRILAIQDTTDINYHRLQHTRGLGYTDGHNTRGIKLHSTLAVCSTGEVAGLLTGQIWNRPFAHKGKAAHRRGRAAQDKESYRWQDHAAAARTLLPAEATVIPIADREADIYEWFAAQRPAHTHLLVRVGQPRRVMTRDEQGRTASLAEAVGRQAVWGQHSINVPRKDDRPARSGTLTIRVAAVQLPPPHNAKQRSSRPLIPIRIIEAREESPPEGSEPVHWRLATTEPIQTWEQVLHALQEYRRRWLLERLHLVIKSGFRIEQLQLETADRLANAVAVCGQAAVRVLRLAHLARVRPEAPACVEFSDTELKVLRAERVRRNSRDRGEVPTIAAAVRVIAQMGGHLGRKNDGPPGVKVLWRGLRVLHQLVRGFLLGQNVSSLPPEYP